MDRGVLEGAKCLLWWTTFVVCLCVCLCVRVCMSMCVCLFECVVGVMRRVVWDINEWFPLRDIYV